MRTWPPQIAVAMLGTLGLSGAGCAERELGSLSRSEAATVYLTVKQELAKVDLLVLGAGEPPREPYDYVCASGTIELRVGLDEVMQPQTLTHDLDACSVDGLTLDGAVAYRNLDRCGDDTPEFAFSGGAILDLAGSINGFCYVEVRDDCGALTGHICGFPAAELISPAPSGARP